MARKLWHDSFAADFGRKNCFFVSNHAQYPVLSMFGITDQNSFSGERNNGLSRCCGMICPLHSTQRAYRITWLSSVAFYHSEPQQNPLSTFFNTIYDRMGSRSKERPRGITGRLVLMESLPYCGCTSQVCFPDTKKVSTEILLKLHDVDLSSCALNHSQTYEQYSPKCSKSVAIHISKWRSFFAISKSPTGSELCFGLEELEATYKIDRGKKKRGQKRKKIGYMFLACS